MKAVTKTSGRQNEVYRHTSPGSYQLLTHKNHSKPSLVLLKKRRGQDNKTILNIEKGKIQR
jgi:hypothetical protein